MSQPDALSVESDFQYLLRLLPSDWEARARDLGALRRCRKVPNATVLLRVLLIHLAEGCSLRETSVRAREGGLVELSDVAIMDRLRRAGEWFRWMGREVMAQWIARQPGTVFGDRWTVRVIDGTQVSEPGPTGSSWRIHYSVGLPSLRCDELYLSDSQGAGSGETFRRFAVHAGDLFMGDRVYALPQGIAHVGNGGGDVLVRFGWKNLPLWSSPRRKFDLFAHLRRLRGTALGDWPALVRHAGRLWRGRVCAVKKSRQAAEAAQRKVRRRAQKHSAEVSDESLEAAGYVFVFTTVAKELLGAAPVLEFYRGRWQVELVFKRLKSILGLGHLRKNDPEAARAWIHGKLFVAFLLEALLRCGESFFPWGYPIQPPRGT